MAIRKEITKDNELYIWMNGKCIYKRWLDKGYSKTFDVMAYDKGTYKSYTDIEIENTPQLVHVKSKLRMYTTEKGGRTNGFKSGYRPNHVFEYDEGRPLNTFIGDIQFEGYDLFMPGDEKIVTTRFLFHQPIEQYLNIGRKWWIHEAYKVLGEAEMLEIWTPRDK